MKYPLFISIIIACVSSQAVYSQVHNQDLTPNTFFPSTPTEFIPTRHFDGLTIGQPSVGGTVFIGGNLSSKPITWQSMPDNVGDLRFKGSRKAALVDYSHWNHLWTLKFSDNATPAAGDIVSWKTMLQIQLDPNPVMKFCGSFCSNEININSVVSWCDFVFDADYKLMRIGELEKYIADNKHLPDVPSEEEVIENGIDVTEMLQIQMKKIEELTLYIIEQQKKIDAISKRLNGLEDQ